ncbi:MAG: hypothetical protein JXB39_09210 [Deltaproteobacteria bacterium]|nr:hypothetical protein [Deltaproteobacteria bacterium]
MTSDAPDALPPTSPLDVPPALPVRRASLAGDFVDFLLHNKAWWLTPIILILLAVVAFILFAEASPVLPFIYTIV